MDAVVIASDQADALAAEAAETMHADLSGALGVKVEAVLAAARAGSPVGEAQSDLVAWCRSVLVPHLRAVESTLYPAAAHLPEGRLLVEALLADDARIAGLVEDLGQGRDTVAAAADAQTLRVVVESQLSKGRDQILPLLVGASDVSASALLEQLRDLTAEGGSQGGHAREQEGHACQCNEAEASTLPELDAREIPHAIRHATIFGALDGLAVGRGLVLVAPHDPLPLLAQLEGRSPGAFSIDYLERGPEAWRLSMVRVDLVGSNA